MLSKIKTTIIALVATITLIMAQTPNMINNQGVAHNANGTAIANQAIKVRLKIHNTTAAGTIQYSEVRNVTTVASGLFNIQIGSTGGDVFYRKLFIDVPEVKKLFTTSREEQSAKLVYMLSLIVARLERLQQLTDDIKQLAKRHAGYGVTDKHYEYVGNALIWTLQQALRSSWDKEMEDAWLSCYQLLADTMIQASKEVD